MYLTILPMTKAVRVQARVQAQAMPFICEICPLVMT